MSSTHGLGNGVCVRRDPTGARVRACDPCRCQRAFTVLMDGRPYRRGHGGAMVLERWIKGEIA